MRVKTNYTLTLITTIISIILFLFLFLPAVWWLITGTWETNSGGSNLLVVLLLIGLTLFSSIIGLRKLYKLYRGNRRFEGYKS